MIKLFILSILITFCFSDEVDGRSQLHNYVYYEKYSDVVNLLNNNADTEVSNKAGLTPLHIAIKKET